MPTVTLKDDVYYGYTSMKLKFDGIKNKEEEITLKLKRTYFGYIT